MWMHLGIQQPSEAASLTKICLWISRLLHIHLFWCMLKMLFSPKEPAVTHLVSLRLIYATWGFASTRRIPYCHLRTPAALLWWNGNSLLRGILFETLVIKWMKFSGTLLASHLCLHIDFAKVIMVVRWTVYWNGRILLMLCDLNSVVNLGVNCKISVIYYEFN